jgi:hypothetical protein
MEFIRFIFSSFWVWAGFTIIIATAGNAIAEIIKAFKAPKREKETEVSK